MRRLPLELIERLRALRPKPETPPDHVGFVATAAGIYFLIAAAIEVWRFLAADIVGPIWRLLRSVFVLGVALWLLPSVASAAQEAACSTLGANCICSEPSQGTVTNNAGGNAGFYRFSDSDKPCFGGGLTNVAGYAGGQDISKTTDATMLAALPNRTAAMASAARRPTGHTGSWFYGGELSGSNVRTAARWYWYLTSDAQLKDCFNNSSGCPEAGFPATDTCENSKMVELGQQQVIDLTQFIHTYHFLNFSPSSGCCSVGPGPDSTGTWEWPRPSSAMDPRGKWWRVEVALTNRAGPNYRTEMWMKDVTTVGAVEKKPIDTADGGQLAANMTPNAAIHQIVANLYRQADSAGSSCSGSYAVAYYMSAQWNTSAGQRIGAAAEVEGGASTPRGFILRLVLPLAALAAALAVAAWSRTQGVA